MGLPPPYVITIHYDAASESRENLHFFRAAPAVCLPYIGFPRTLNALACINEVLPEKA